MGEPLTSPPGLPRPGWYHDGTGLRWWDGRGWGPAAPAQAPVDPVAAGTTSSLLAHLSFLFLAVILPVILRVTEGERNDYVRHHTTEALNFQLTFLLAWVAGIVGPHRHARRSRSFDDGNAGAWIVLPFLMLFAIYIAAAVLSVLGAVRASKGVWWRYPVSIRFVRGAVRR